VRTRTLRPARLSSTRIPKIIAALWTGRRISYRCEHVEISNAQFLPVPVHRPRVPVWIAGRWPTRAPFRRAARWDGVFPTFEGVSHAEMPTPEVFVEAVKFTLACRSLPEPMDIILEGQSAGVADADVVAPYAEAGLTGWVEKKLGWFRGTLKEMRQRIRARRQGG